jgi:hypothetical protein
MMRRDNMKYEEWEKLDDLLSKEGYGGYYDLLELLKGYAQSWYKDKFGIDDIKKLEQAIEKVKTIHQATSLLSAIEIKEK